jgi:hypothetical protein
MAPLIYPEPTWSNGFGRVIRTLQVVAIAGAIGAVGGGVAVISLVGGSSHRAAGLRSSTTEQGRADTGKSGTADTAAGAATAAAAVPQPNAAAPAQAAPAAQASPQHAPPAAEPSPHVAAIEQGADRPAEPASSAPDTQVYNRAEPDKDLQAHPSRARAKATRRTKFTERGRRERTAPSSNDTSRYSDARRDSDAHRAPYPAERYSYYDPPPMLRAPQQAPRGFYFGGGGGFYDRGGSWGD